MAIKADLLAAAMRMGMDGGEGAPDSGTAEGSPSAGPAPPAPPPAPDFHDRPLTDREEQKLLHPLLRLRQACCHPQVGAGGIKAVQHGGHHHHRALSMGEILEVDADGPACPLETTRPVLPASLQALPACLYAAASVCTPGGCGGEKWQPACTKP